MADWIPPSTHVLKATEYLTDADTMAAKAGITVESLPRLTLLVALASAHTELARAKRP